MNGKALMLICITIVSVSVAAVASLAIPAQAAGPVTTITVTTFNSSYHLSARTAPRGVVIFKVTNTAHFRHDFSIKGRTTRVLLQGQSATLRVTFLQPGRYTYKCTVDHHASWGQEGVFTIT
jgi:plastocyanin